MRPKYVSQTWSHYGQEREMYNGQLTHSKENEMNTETEPKFASNGAEIPQVFPDQHFFVYRMKYTADDSYESKSTFYQALLHEGLGSGNVFADRCRQFAKFVDERSIDFLRFLDVPNPIDLSQVRLSVSFVLHLHDPNRSRGMSESILMTTFSILEPGQTADDPNEKRIGITIDELGHLTFLHPGQLGEVYTFPDRETIFGLWRDMEKYFEKNYKFFQGRA